MAKKKVTKKGTVEKAAPKSKLNKTQEIKKALAATPGKSPTAISEALTAKGVEVSPAYVSTIKTKLKAKKAAPKAAAPKKVTKKKASRKKRSPKAAATSDITFEQLRMAKEMAQQLGSAEKAKEALAALSQLLG